MYKVAFTEEDDALLMKYIATYNPQLRGRLGKKLYERLVENAERKWSFSSRHSAQSWRERYKNNQLRFDAQILKYQKKHGITANSSDNSSSHATVQRSNERTLLSSSRPHSDIMSSPMAPFSGSGAKKRPREVDSKERRLDSGVLKKMRRENVSVQRDRPNDSPSPTSASSVELQNGGKADAGREDEAAPTIGPDDYKGALSGSGESDREVESQSEGEGVSPSLRPSCPSSLASKDKLKPPVAPRISTNPSHIGTTPVPKELAPPYERQDCSPRTIVTEAEASRSVGKSAAAPLQLMQEPTRPHTSAISSLCSPPLRQPSPTIGTSSQLGIVPQHLPSAYLKQRRIPSSPRKRTVVPGEEDDIFCTSPPQAVRANPPARARGREAPRLVEGPFRSTYNNANGAFRLMLRGRRVSGMDDEVETDGEDEWPPRRGKRKSPISSEGSIKGDSNLREREQSIVKAQQHTPPSGALYAREAVPLEESRPTERVVSAIEPALTNKNAQDSIPPISEMKSPSQVTQGVASAVTDILEDQLPSPERDLSRHGPIQSKGPAPLANHNYLLFPVVSAHEFAPPVPGPPVKRPSLGFPNPPAHDDSVNHPLTVPLVNHQGRRRTLGGDSEVPRTDARREKLLRRASVQHIDLRALHSGRSVGTSLTGSTMSLGRSNGSSVVKKKRPRRPPKSSTPPNLSESNKELVLTLGLEAVYTRMAENHKFHIDVVREVATRQRSLEDADRVLRNMREAAGREYARLVRQAAYSTVKYETEASEEDNEDNTDKSGDEEDNSQRGRTRQLTLQITTESPEPSLAQPPHYSPPTPTRAHGFRRLERQGRLEEARLREARRVRRSLQLVSAEASPEVDERRIMAYLLQLQEDDDMDGISPKKPWDIKGIGFLGERNGDDEMQENEGGVRSSISPGLEEKHADAVTGQFLGDGLAKGDEAQANMATDLRCDLGTPDHVHDNDSTSPLGQDLDNSRGYINGDPLDETRATKLSHRMSELEDEDADTADVEVEVDDDGDHQTLSPVDYETSATNEHQTPEGDELPEGIRRYNSPLGREHGAQTISSLSCAALDILSLLDEEWTNSDDELLLDGDLIAHEELVKRKGLGSVKFRTAHLYGLLLDG
ncbi:hypothetical protein BJV74DRAFT_813765 [Russula compacta]|nr:hypothetical protein BJV74DRAFT_813765 [Russula compacta]